MHFPLLSARPSCAKTTHTPDHHRRCSTLAPEDAINSDCVCSCPRRIGSGKLPRTTVLTAGAIAATAATAAAPSAETPRLSLPALGRPQVMSLVTPGMALEAAAGEAESPSPRLFGVLSAVGTPAGAGRAAFRRGVLMKEAEQVQDMSDCCERVLRDPWLVGGLRTVVVALGGGFFFAVAAPLPAVSSFSLFFFHFCSTTVGVVACFSRSPSPSDCFLPGL